MEGWVSVRREVRLKCVRLQATRTSLQTPLIFEALTTGVSQSYPVTDITITWDKVKWCSVC